MNIKKTYVIENSSIDTCRWMIIHKIKYYTTELHLSYTYHAIKFCNDARKCIKSFIHIADTNMKSSSSDTYTITCDPRVKIIDTCTNSLKINTLNLCSSLVKRARTGRKIGPKPFRSPSMKVRRFTVIGYETFQVLSVP